MKKFFMIICAVSLLVGGYFGFRALKSNSVQALIKTNVEALTRCEPRTGWIYGDFYVTYYSQCRWDCDPGGMHNCPI